MKLNFLQSKRICQKHGQVLAICLGIGVFCFVVRGAEKTFTLPPETATLKPGPGMAEASQCLVCHSADYISIQPRLTRTVWKAEVVKMQQKYGAPIQTNMIDRLVDYLTLNYGQENPPTNAVPTK